MNAFMLAKGLETLSLHGATRNALKVAGTFSNMREKVSWVIRWFATSEFYPLAEKYMQVSRLPFYLFGLKDGYEAGVRFL